MLDEKDLQAIAQLMAQQRRDIMQDVKTLLESQWRENRPPEAAQSVKRP